MININMINMINNINNQTIYSYITEINIDKKQK